MTVTLLEESPPLGMQEFPGNLWLVRHVVSGKHLGCTPTELEGNEGLACFCDKKGAQLYINEAKVDNCRPVRVPFNKARETAKKCPDHVVALVLINFIDPVQVHWVK